METKQDYIKKTLSDSIKSLKSKSKNYVCIDTDTFQITIINLIENAIRFAESQNHQPKTKSVQQDIERKAYEFYPSYNNTDNIPLQQAFIQGAQWMNSLTNNTDYEFKYELALKLAKSWYDHHLDGYNSTSDIIEKHPQSYNTILHLFADIETFLPNMFTELNNDDEWWDNYIKQLNNQ